MPKSPALPPIVLLALALLPAGLAAPGALATLAGLSVLLGWLGSGLLATSLLLMIREPSVAARFGGLERMYRWHHALGTLGYIVLLAHPLALAGHRLPAGPDAAWKTLAPWSWSSGLGWLALLGLMAGLAGTFVLRLRYRWWRLVHAALGGSVVLGIAHLLAVRPPAVGSALVIAPTVLALGWRLLRADRGGGARPYEVHALTRPGHRIVELTLRPLAEPLAVKPGQFVMLALFAGPRYRGCGEYHPLTVSGTRPDGSLSLSVKALGDCTHRIQSLEPGVAARIQGPFGTFLADRTEAPELWIAGGIGITPFLAALRAGPVIRPTELVYLDRDTDAAAYCDELRGYAERQPLLRFRPLALRDDHGPLHALLETVPQLSARQTYLCGPPPLVDATVRWLRQRGIPRQHIHYERFDFR